jgi:hypothetical protein
MTRSVTELTENVIRYIDDTISNSID